LVEPPSGAVDVWRLPTRSRRLRCIDMVRHYVPP
jgi:hypothetical protein